LPEAIMHCTRSRLRTILLAFALVTAMPESSFAQANPAPVGGPDEILPPNTNPAAEDPVTTIEGGNSRRNRCAGIDCLRFGEKEELFWLCSTLAQQGFQVDDKALCTAIGNWKAAQLGGQ
jgi:hypothetical protein